MGSDAGPNNGALYNTTALGRHATTTANDQVRIGSEFIGSIGGYEPWSNVSDARFKKDIQEDIPGLAFISKLRPVSYDLDRTKIRSFLRKDQKTDGVLPENMPSQKYRREVGFVAQEVEQILKENEMTPIGVETPQNENDHYSIRYSEFVVPLVKAVQELSEQNQQQKQHIEALEERIDILEGSSVNKSSQLNNGASSKSENISTVAFSLQQNVPNPFHQTTTIKMVIPKQVQQAKIVIYDLNGLELERYHISERGNTDLEISGGRFPSGMYIYALLVDGQMIDSKKMILTK